MHHCYHFAKRQEKLKVKLAAPHIAYNDELLHVIQPSTTECCVHVSQFGYFTKFASGGKAKSCSSFSYMAICTMTATKMNVLIVRQSHSHAMLMQNQQQQIEKMGERKMKSYVR